MSRERALYPNVKEKLDNDEWVTMYVEGIVGVPPYFYTIGLSKLFDIPEIIVFGIDKADINDLAEKVANIVALNAGMMDEEIAHEGVLSQEVCFHMVGSRQKTSLMDGLYCLEGKAPHSVDVYQMVVADENNLFPWEEGVSDELVKKQPLLTPKRSFHVSKEVALTPIYQEKRYGQPIYH